MTTLCHVTTFCKHLYRGPVGSGHIPIGAELERMVIIEGLFMEVVSIVI
jgi:hypothetical protein